MVSAWRLRCLPVLLLVYYTLADVEGTNAAGTSSRGQDRRNGANKHRRASTADPHESTTSPRLSTASPVARQRFPVPWVPDADERAGQDNSVKATRKSKGRKDGTSGDHVTVRMEREFPTPGTLPLVTDHVISSVGVTASAGTDGSKRVKPGGGMSFAITRPTAQTIEQMRAAAKEAILERIIRVKTTAKTTTTTTRPTPTTPRTTPSTTTTRTTTKLPLRKNSTTPTSARPPSPFGGRTTSATMFSNRTASKSSSAKVEGCSSSCEIHRCETVEAEMCQGRVVKDRCNCCPVCLVEQRTDEWMEDVTTKRTSHHPSNACDGMQCPKHKVCILNIQGIPMCRCPNIYTCRGIDRSPLCAQNGETYKNKCFLKVDECTLGRRIRIVHKGSCRSKSTSVQLEAPVMVTSKTSRFDADDRTLEATHRKSGKNDPWRHAATDSDVTKSAKLRKRSGNKSQFP